MTELEAFITVVGTDKDARRYFDRTPEWWRGLLPKNVSWGYRAETDRYYVGASEGPSLGIALARYTQKPSGDFHIRVLPHTQECLDEAPEDCTCRCWAVYFKDQELTRHDTAESARDLQQRLNSNRRGYV